MVLLKDESVKIMNEFDRKNRSAVMNLLTHRFSIPEYDADDILQDAWVFLLDKLTVGEMHDVPEKLSAYLTTVCSYKAHEYLRQRQAQNRNISFDDESITDEKLKSFEMEAQSWEDFLEECRRAEHHKLFLMERELERLTPRETALLMGYYETDGSKTSMKQLADKLGYNCDRVAITLKSRIIKKLKTGIQQQESALGNGLSPVAFFKAIFNQVNIILKIERPLYHVEFPILSPQSGESLEANIREYNPIRTQSIPVQQIPPLLYLVHWGQVPINGNQEMMNLDYKPELH